MKMTKEQYEQLVNKMGSDGEFFPDMIPAIVDEAAKLTKESIWTERAESYDIYAGEDGEYVDTIDTPMRLREILETIGIELEG